jgi:hypothetical protein
MPRDREKQRIAQRRYEKKRVRPHGRKEYMKQYHQQPEVKEKRRKYEQRPEVKEKRKEYYQRPEVKEKRKEYYQQPEHKKRKYELRKNNPIHKKRTQLRHKVNKAVIHQSCFISTIHKLIGCSVPEARDHLESQFEPWMSWDNYGSGKGKWCIDHIIRVSSIDIFDEDEVKRIFHYTNMRPLCFVKNSADTDDR